MTHPTPRHIVILEPEYTGHRMSYAAALARFAIHAGATVTVATTRDALRSEELRLHLGPLVDTLQFVDLGGLADLEASRYQQRLRRIVSRLQTTFPGCEIIVSEGDKFVLPAALSVDGIDWRNLRVLVMRAPERGDGLRSRTMNLAKLLGIALLTRRGAAVRVLAPATEVMDEYRVGRFPAVPDPIDVVLTGEPLPAEMQRLRDEPGRLWVGVVGHITRRKNLDLIIEAACRRGPAGTGLVLAGKIAEDELVRCRPLLDRFTREGGQLIMVNRLLTDAELDASVLAVDVVVLAHSAEGPSGILGRAVALGTPVVAAGAPSLLREAERLSAGACAPLEAGAIAEALDRTREHETRPLKMADSSEFARCLIDV